MANGWQEFILAWHPGLESESSVWNKAASVTNKAERQVKVTSLILGTGETGVTTATSKTAD